MGYLASVTMTQLCHCGVKAATDSTVIQWVWLYCSKTLCTKKPQNKTGGWQI